ncbi:hypothetical protein [Pseudomonas rhizosphaerae]|uniref:hypothetical protein n=1 Tax=Pseudomonas rhizosphaerae TaxID=216142 RepID=UPI002B463ACB|nr:hypothetical protein [Pseudomonas rhizosphaerae]MEB2870255.1 hypothetical protein [Pseudomonas rhizosphaerae]
MFISILLAILGAAAGAYFAVIKTKREKLWDARYELLGSALEKANLLFRFLDSEINGEHEIHGLTKHEKDELDKNWPITRYALAKDMTMLQMLFSEAEVAEALAAWSAMESALFDLLEEASSHDAHEYVSKARPHAGALEGALITISRKKCLGWI